MGHQARTLPALVAGALAALLLGAAAASAQPVVVRAETRDMNSIATGAFVPRQLVQSTDVTIHDIANGHADQTCADTSPVAALAAAVGASSLMTQYDATTGKWLLASLRGVGPAGGLQPPAQPKWSWRIYADQAPIDNGGTWQDGDVCTSVVPPSSEVLAYQACGTQTFGCYSGTPLYLRIRDGGPYDIAPQTVPPNGAPVVVKVFGDPPIGTPAAALFGTDEATFTPSSSPATGPLAGMATVSFTAPGPHQVIGVAQNGSRPPARMAVCASAGNDGYCGSTNVQAPAVIPYVTPSPCATNGHDGLCGTVDTSGPVTHVTNIIDKKVFKARKAPGQVKGTIDTDPNGVGAVKLRLVRTTTARVLVRTRRHGRHRRARKRYRTVTRCLQWNDDRLLFERQRRCGAKHAPWFTAELNDLRNGFSYSFAMTLPAGSYTLEVLSTDEDGHPDAVVPGRDVLTFTVSR